jgi:hypothetical protein
MLLNLNLRRIRYYTLTIGKYCQHRNTMRMNHKHTIEDDLQWKMIVRVSFRPIVVCNGVLTMKWKTAKDVNKEDKKKI